MSEFSGSSHVLRVADLPQRKPHRFDLNPDDVSCTQIAQSLGISAVRKLSFKGQLKPAGRNDWRLEATLGATVVQPCVVTLKPVTTRIECAPTRLFVRDWVETAESDEIEMPEDDSIEPLGNEIDLMSVLTEALALEIPDYPRSPDAALEQSTFSGDGIQPMSDEDVKPFASLAAFKNKLEKGGK